MTKSSLKPLIENLSQYIYNDCFNIHNAVIDALIKNDIEIVSSKIDEENINKAGVEVKITTDDSKIPCYIIPTDEEVMMARETYEFLK